MAYVRAALCAACTAPVIVNATVSGHGGVGRSRARAAEGAALTHLCPLSRTRMCAGVTAVLIP